MPHPITGVNKWRYDLVLQGNYGHGWEDLCEYADPKRDREDARDDLKAHRENEPYSFRLITRRSLEPEYDYSPADYLLRARNLRSMSNIAKENAEAYADKAQRYSAPEVNAGEEWLAGIRDRAANQARLAVVLRDRARDAARKGKALRNAQRR